LKEQLIISELLTEILINQSIKLNT